MKSFFSISCQHSTAQAVIDDCVQQLKDMPEDANFGFIYATDTMSPDYKNLLEACKDHTGIKHWVGTLGAGIISRRQGILRHARSQYYAGEL